MTTEEIRKKLEEVDPKRPSKKTKPFFVLNYRHGDGKVCNYELAPFWDAKSYNNNMTAYQRLLLESLALAEAGKINADYEDIGLTLEEWEVSKEKQMEAWRIAIAKIDNEEDKKKAKEQAKKLKLQYNSKGHFFTDPEDPEVTVLMARKILSREVVRESEDPKTIGLDSADPIVRGKALYRSASPIGNYLPMLKLRPDNIKSVVN